MRGEAVKNAEARELWEEIFSEDSREFLDYYDEWKMKDNLLETRYRDGRLVSMVHWNPYRIRAGEGIWQSYYIIAVATRPEYRHQGLMADQLITGMNRFRGQGVPFVFLMPADPAIYTPFDFRYIYRKAEVSLRKAEVSAESCWKIRPLRVEEYGAASEFANRRLCASFDLFAERAPEFWRRTEAECRSEGGAVEGIFSEGNLIGILDWWGEDPVEIRELILEKESETEDGRRALTAALHRRFPDAEEITLVTTGWWGGRKPIIMGRIVHVGEFLKLLSAEKTEEIRIRIEDRYIPENNGCFLWKIGPEGSEIQRTEGMPDLSCSIAGLMERLSGSLSSREEDLCPETEKGRRFAAEFPAIRGCFFPEIV